jgi:small subunit ribosomal protein S6
MAKAPPIYDLMLLLSTGAPDELRAKILSDVEQAISSVGGAIERNDDWGTRTLAYQIEHQTDAEYHLLQFSGPASLLEALSHSLKIADGVLRFRIIKVLPGTPPAPDPRSAAPVASAPVAVSPEPAEVTAEA